MAYLACIMHHAGSGVAKQEETIMQAVVRAYSGKGAKELFDLLEKHKADVEKLMRSVKGFAGYTLVRTGDGGISVTVCQDKAGIDESMQKAKDWVAKNAGSTGVAAPKVSAGSVIAHLK
jgi:restriction endonuclease Mrr